MKEIERLVKDGEQREMIMRQKVCLVLNAKKTKIAELKGINLEDLKQQVLANSLKCFPKLS